MAGNHIVQKKNEAGEWESLYSGDDTGAKEHHRKLNDRAGVRVISAEKWDAEQAAAAKARGEDVNVG